MPTQNDSSFMQHRKKYEGILRNDPEYDSIIKTIQSWEYFKHALNDTLHGVYLHGVTLEKWDRLGDACWGPYSFHNKDGEVRRCSKRGPATLAERVCTLKEAVRLMQHGDIPVPIDQPLSK